MISPANTYPGLTKAGKGEANEPDVYYPNGCARNYTRVVPADDLQGRAGALWASQLGVTKAYVLDDTQLYGKGIADVFANEAPGLRRRGPRPRRHRRQGDRLQGPRREDQGDQPGARLLRRHHPEQRRPAVARPARRAGPRRQADGPGRHLRGRVARGRRRGGRGHATSPSAASRRIS